MTKHGAGKRNKGAVMFPEVQINCLAPNSRVSTVRRCGMLIIMS